MGVLRKKLKHTVIQKYIFIDILINVKADRVNWGAKKVLVYHGRRVGQAWFSPLNNWLLSNALLRLVRFSEFTYSLAESVYTIPLRIVTLLAYEKQSIVGQATEKFTHHRATST
jgi:hypothetical protein